MRSDNADTLFRFVEARHRANVAREWPPWRAQLKPVPPRRIGRASRSFELGQRPGTVQAVSAPAIRRATPTDAAAIAEVHVASFKAAHRGLVPLDHVTVERREAAWRAILAAAPSDGFTLAAEREGQVVGFCHVATPSRDPDVDPATAELTSIYVAPGQWRAGTGAALLDAALSQLVTGGWHELTLWVLAANDRARSFYGAFDLTPDGGQKRHEPSGQYEVRLRLRLP